MSTDNAAMTWPALTAVSGQGRGEPLLLEDSLSFWGGYDAGRGCIVEIGHAQLGAALAGRVMLMARAKGSSSSSSVLVEAIRNGTGPAAIIMREPDLIVGLGCIVASELYGCHVPVVVVSEIHWAALEKCCRTGQSDLDVVAAGSGEGMVLAWPRTPG